MKLFFSKSYTYHLAIRQQRGGQTGKQSRIYFFSCNYIFLLVYISIKVNSKPIEYLIQCFSAHRRRGVQSIRGTLGIFIVMFEMP